MIVRGQVVIEVNQISEHAFTRNSGLLMRYYELIYASHRSVVVCRTPNMLVQHIMDMRIIRTCMNDQLLGATEDM